MLTSSAHTICALSEYIHRISTNNSEQFRYVTTNIIYIKLYYMLQSSLTFIHLYFVVMKINYASSASKLRQPLVYNNELVMKCY